MKKVSTTLYSAQMRKVEAIRELQALLQDLGHEASFVVARNVEEGGWLITFEVEVNEE